MQKDYETMRSLLTRGLAALVAAGSLAAVAPAAHAETWRTADRWHDVRAVATRDSDSAVAPARNRTSDITALRVDHGARWVTVTVTLREIAPRDRVVEAQLDLPGAATATIESSRFGGRAVATAGLEVVEGDTTSWTRCRATTTVQPRRGVVRMSVRRDCLGDPAWVRANAMALTWSNRSREDSDRLFLDRAIGSSLTKTPPYGPRVHAG
jgi:hypothetical protein